MVSKMLISEICMALLNVMIHFQYFSSMSSLELLISLTWPIFLFKVVSYFHQI